MEDAYKLFYNRAMKSLSHHKLPAKDFQIKNPYISPSRFVSWGKEQGYAVHHICEDWVSIGLTEDALARYEELR